MKSIHITICTCKRPVMLQACLQSVIETRIPAECAVKLVIVDNNGEPTAKPIVDEIIKNCPIDIIYIHEPRRGIPVARNRALEFAKQDQADFLIFIDDDEVVTADWLAELLSYAAIKGGQAVIHGRILSECPPDAPEYLSKFFTKNKFKPTGKQLASCATDNVLIPMLPIIEHNLRFDDSRPLAGGTDTLFFCAAHGKGIEIFSCAEAIVIEKVPLNRISLKWLSKRKFRAGINIGERKLETGQRMLFVILEGIITTIIRLTTALIWAIVGQKHLAAKEWLKACRKAGSIGGFIGFRANSYNTIDGY